VRAYWGTPKQFPKDASAEEILQWAEDQFRELISHGK
jgi:hypothetical protein